MLARIRISVKKCLVQKVQLTKHRIYGDDKFKNELLVLSWTLSCFKHIDFR